MNPLQARTLMHEWTPSPALRQHIQHCINALRADAERLGLSAAPS